MLDHLPPDIYLVPDLYEPLNRLLNGMYLFLLLRDNCVC